MAINTLYGQKYVGSIPELFGFRIDSISNTSLNIFGGCARAINSDFIINYPGNTPDLPYYILLNLANVGLNGCYPNPLSQIVPASGSIYVAIMAVGDSTGKNPPGVVAATASTGFLPPGYDSYRPVNIFLLNTSGQAVNMVQSGMFSERSYMFHDGVQFLSAGNATSATTLDLVALTGIIPPKPMVTSVNVSYQFVPSTSTHLLNLVPTGLTSTSRTPVIVQASTNVGIQGNVNVVPGYNPAATSNASIDYFVTNSADSASLWIAGFNLTFDLVLT